MKSIITDMLSDLYLSRSVYFHLLKHSGKRDRYFEIYNAAQIEILEEIIDELKDKEQEGVTLLLYHTQARGSCQ